MMPQSTSPFAYPDIRELLERALASSKGIRVPCENHGKAKNLVHRINGCRATDRRENKKVYPPGDPMHNRSPYDVISVRVPPAGSEDDHYVYLVNLGGIEIQFEEL